MERSIAVVLLVLSLGALAAAASNVDTILLPGDGKGPMEKGVGEERPWTCCDHTICTPSIPKFCGCRDTVPQCASACQICDQVGPSHYVCQDSYEGWPGPRCTYDDAAVVGAGN